MRRKSDAGIKPSLKQAQKKPSSAFVSKDEHFKSLGQSLCSLKKNEKLTDLRLVCAFKNKFKTIYAHKAVLAPLSTLLNDLCGVAKIEQPGEPVFITLDDVDPVMVEKLLEYLYMGQVYIPRKNKVLVAQVCDLLQLNVTLDDPLSSESSESDSEPEPAKKVTQGPVKKPKIVAKCDDSDSEHPKKATPGPLKKHKMTSKEDSDSECVKKSTPGPQRRAKVGPKGKTAVSRGVPLKVASSKAAQSSEEEEEDSDEEEKKLKEVAAKSKSTIPLEHLEKSSDKEVQRYMKQIKSLSKATPSIVGKQTSGVAPQKRRMAEFDKKVETKDSKKMRQDDSSSDVDSDALEKRKSEVAIKEKKMTYDDSSESEEERDKKKSQKKLHAIRPSSDSEAGRPVTPRLQKKVKSVKDDSEYEEEEAKFPLKKSKAGPASKGKIKTESASPALGKEKMRNIIPEAIFATEGIQICGECSSIFVSVTALEEHTADKHAKKVSHSSTDNASSDDEGSQKQTIKKPILKKPVVKKPAAKIKEERKQSNARSSSPSSSEADDESPPPKKPAAKKNIKNASPSDAASSKVSKRQSSLDCKMIGCTMCDESFDKSVNFRNHFLNHFKDQFNMILPNSKPYACPECKAISRDKISLMRHFAFSHKKILDYCTASDLAGRPLDSGTGSIKSGKGRPSLSVKSPRIATKAKAQKLDSLSDDAISDSGEERNGKDEQNHEDIAKESKESSPVHSDKRAEVQPVKFSDESDDDFISNSAASKAIKSFDDLFGNEEPASSGKTAEKKDGVTFNKDSDSDDDTTAKKSTDMNDPLVTDADGVSSD